MPIIDIRHVEEPEHLAHIRDLFREYQASIDTDLCFQGFTAELAGLPGSYAAPRGRLLLASIDGTPGACVALHAVSDEACEMKRLFVRPAHRGLGLGRMLVDRVLEDARAIGYRRICLDTLPSMSAAQAIYETLGFVDIPAYRANPVSGTRYMGRAL